MPEVPKTQPPGQAIELAEFLSLKFPPRKWLLRGLLQDRDLGMVHSWRGIGKTYLSHGIAYALASGGTFLRWEAPEPKGVLIVDGEMPREDLQKRLVQLVLGAEREATAPLKILAADAEEDPFPSLETEAGQQLVEQNLEGVSLIVLDNVSTLCSSARPENEAESWQLLQKWLLSLRRRGYTVWLVHHEGISGRQRGTSKREDVLAQVVRLKRPDDYRPSEGARFEVHFTKSRGVFGAEAEPFEAQLMIDERGRAVWTWKLTEDANLVQVRELYGDGITNQREIANRAGIGVATVNRKIQQLREKGEVP
ncbi:MAG: AAA family ATPase [Acidobacteria bacterium]|nr:AAA family ATPase [Acidobacteriota bacterium]